MNVDWGGLATVLAVGLVAGVGLVALFALGVRILATQPAAHRGAGAVAGAVACFTVCAGLGSYGIFLLLSK